MEWRSAPGRRPAEFVVQAVLALMKGVPRAIATSWQAKAARTSEPGVSGRSVLPQQKLSRIASRRGSAPHRHRVADRLVDRGGDHPVGVQIAVVGIHSIGDHQP